MSRSPVNCNTGKFPLDKAIQVWYDLGRIPVTIPVLLPKPGDKATW